MRLFSYHTAGKYSRLTRSTLSSWPRPAIRPLRRTPKCDCHDPPLVRLLGVALVALVGVTACGSDNTPSAASTAGTTAADGTTSAATELPAAELSLVAYSTPQAAYEQIIKAFNATTQGKNITFTQSYGASGDQSRAVVAGLSADYVAFSLGARRDPPRQGRLRRCRLERGSSTAAT